MERIKPSTFGLAALVIQGSKGAGAQGRVKRLIRSKVLSALSLICVFLFNSSLV